MVKSLWIILLIIINPVIANTDVQAQRNLIQLTQKDRHNIIFVSEQMALHKFTPQERSFLHEKVTQWMKSALLSSSIKKSLDDYQRYRHLAQRIRDESVKRMVWHQLYRKMIFAKSSNVLSNHVLSLVKRYNPVVLKNNQTKMMKAKKDRLLSEKEGYFLTAPMWVALRVVTSFLSKQSLPPQVVNSLYQWSLADFQETPYRSTLTYAYFLDEVVPMALSPTSLKEQKRYRINTYSHLYFSFRNDPLAQLWKSDLIDIATYYNPIISINEQKKTITIKDGSSEANNQLSLNKQQKIVGNQLLLQSMQVNQWLFNSMIGQFEHSLNEINQSQRSFSNRQTIQMSEGHIVSQQKDRYIVEDETGIHYEVIN